MTFRNALGTLTSALAAFLFAFLSSPASAQTSTPDKLQTLRVDSPVKLDGILDEPVWAKAEHISNFTQRELVENAPATERTEVAVVYNGRELYIGIWCLDSQSFFDFSLGRARPYYSRRIGIYQGRETPIIGGARFLGKMGGTTLGAMVLQTSRIDAANPTNFSLVRLKQDLGEESSVGLLAIGSVQAGHFNGTGGVDALYSTSKLFGDKNFQFGGAFAATYTSGGEDATGTAHRLFVGYPNDLIEFMRPVADLSLIRMAKSMESDRGGV